MAQVEIISESEEAAGWRFDAQILDEAGALHMCSMTLSWADYNLWSGTGADEPAAVAEAVLTFLVGHDGTDGLRPTFDASLARRLHPGADREIPGFIRG